MVTGACGGTWAALQLLQTIGHGWLYLLSEGKPEAPESTSSRLFFDCLVTVLLAYTYKWLYLCRPQCVSSYRIGILVQL